MLSITSAAPLSFAGTAAFNPLSIKMQAEAVPEPEPYNSLKFAKSLPGITCPLDFFDPAGFTTDASEGKIKFYREVELKHGRVAMLASSASSLESSSIPFSEARSTSPRTLPSSRPRSRPSGRPS